MMTMTMTMMMMTMMIITKTSHTLLGLGNAVPAAAVALLRLSYAVWTELLCSRSCNLNHVNTKTSPSLSLLLRSLPRKHNSLLGWILPHLCSVNLTSSLWRREYLMGRGGPVWLCMSVFVCVCICWGGGGGRGCKGGGGGEGRGGEGDGCNL